MGGCTPGNIPPPAQRFRSRLEFSEQETLTTIVNRDFARFVFPHQHAALGRRPVLTLPFQLQHRIYFGISIWTKLSSGDMQDTIGAIQLVEAGRRSVGR